MSNMSLISSLPNEILSYVATFLTPTDLKNCNSVCERLFRLAGAGCLILFDISHTCHDYSLWRRFFVDVNTTACPSGRLCHTSVVNNNFMYIYGGHITQPSSEYFHTVKNDMYECNLITREWREVPVGENAPRRTEHTAVVYDNHMIIFGGYSGNGYENSVMSCDFQTGQWEQLKTIGESPSARSAHTAVVVGSCMYVFGGWNGIHCMNDLYAIEGANESSNKGYLDDLYEFHFDTKKWYKSKTWGTAPSPRSRFRMIPYKDSIYLFAGWNSAKHFSTLHRYCVTNKQWIEVSTTFDEDGIGQFSMVEYQGIMYVFSGYSPKLGCRTNLFAYPLAPAMNKQAR